MEKQKTALNQFVDWYKDAKWKGSPGYDEIIEKATELLEAERKQLEKTFDVGFAQNVYLAGHKYEEQKKKYFDDTFKLNK